MEEAAEYMVGAQGRGWKPRSNEMVQTLPSRPAQPPLTLGRGLVHQLGGQHAPGGNFQPLSLKDLVQKVHQDRYVLRCNQNHTQ